MTLFIETRGQGEDVVLLHGWGMNSDVWQSIIPVLQENYCIHRVDLPGYGESTRVDPYDLATVTQRISAHFPLPVHIIGWSLGGLIGMQWALSEPEKIKSLTLVASSPCFMQKPGWNDATPSSDLQHFAESLVTDYEGLIRRFLALQVIGSNMALKALRILEQQILMRTPPDAKVLLEGLAILEEADLRARIKGVTCPVLLQYGAKDRMAPLKVGEWLEANLEDAKLITHAKAAHLPFVSHSEDFLNAQYDFLRAI